MRILHVKASLSLRLGGSVQAVFDICRAAICAGDECQIVTTADASALRPTKRPVAALDVPILEFEASWPARLGNSWGMARWLTRNIRTFDLVELHEVFTAASLVTAVLARVASVPYIVRPHGSLDPYDLQKHRLAKLLLSPVFGWLLLGGASAIGFTSDQERLRSRVWGSRAAKYSTPLPVEPPSLPGDRDRFRSSIEVKDQTFVALFLSRIDYKKGLVTLLQAVHDIRSGGRDLELVVAGEGSAEFTAYVRSVVSRLALGKAVHFIGFVTDQRKADAFAGADAFVLPSDNENFGISIVEALYSGVPVIISSGVYLSPELSSMGAALQVQPTAKSVQAAVTQLMGDPNLRSRLSEAGKRAAHSIFNPALIAERERAIRQEILDRRIPGAYSELTSRSAVKSLVGRRLRVRRAKVESLPRTPS